MEQTPQPSGLDREYAKTSDTHALHLGPSGILQPYNFGILRSLSSNFEIFEGVLTDSQVQSSLAERRLALVAKNWNVDAASEAPADVAAADFMRELIKGLEWDDITEKMHWGVYYGFSVAELMYARDGRFVTVDRVISRKRTRFRFDIEGHLRLLTRKDAVDGEIMPPGKFWHFATGGDNHENPYGIGLAHWLYWPVYFKNNGLKFWSIFLDKFAMPTAMGVHEYSGNTAKINELVEALEAIHTDSGIAVPKGVEISLLEARRSGTTDYETFCDYMDRAISKVTVGQVASSEGTPGRLGNEDLQANVREDIIKADADLICESWNRGPGRWLTQWNFPGAKPPRVWREVETTEDLNTRAERDVKLHTIGFKPTLDYITETYGEGYEAKPEPKPFSQRGDGGGDRNPGPQDDPEFAAPRVLPPEDSFKRAIDDLLDDNATLNTQTAQIIEPVFALVRRHGPERALSHLVEVYPRIRFDRLTEAIARAQFVAETWGRLSAAADHAG